MIKVHIENDTDGIVIDGQAPDVPSAVNFLRPLVAALLARPLSENLDIARSYQDIRSELTALRGMSAESAVSETTMADQQTRIRAILENTNAATNEIANDVAKLIEKVKAGAPNLLTEDELVKAEATVARLQAIASTDPDTIVPAGETAPTPTPATGDGSAPIA